MRDNKIEEKEKRQKRIEIKQDKQRKGDQSNAEDRSAEAQQIRIGDNTKRQ